MSREAISVPFCSTPEAAELGTPTSSYFFAKAAQQLRRKRRETPVIKAGNPAEKGGKFTREWQENPQPPIPLVC